MRAEHHSLAFLCFLVFVQLAHTLYTGCTIDTISSPQIAGQDFDVTVQNIVGSGFRWFGVGTDCGFSFYVGVGSTQTVTINCPTGLTGTSVSFLSNDDGSAPACTSNSFDVITPFVATVTPTAAVCFGETGSAKVVVSGGSGTYTYTWTPNVGTSATVTGLTPGVQYQVVVTDTADPSKTDTKTVTVTAPTQVTASITQHTDILCKGATTGLLKAEATGGNPGTYTYVWRNTDTGSVVGNGQTLSGVPAGTYSVTFGDSRSCTNSPITDTLIEPATSVTLSDPIPSDVKCPGGEHTGSATITGSGGTGTLSYAWNNGVTSITNSATGLASGSYKVVATDTKGCHADYTFTISDPPSFVTSSVHQVDVTCFGDIGSATVGVTGGTGGYKYAWDHGITSQTDTATGLLGSTAYTVTITDDNSCTTTKTFNIAGPTLPLVAAPAHQDIICHGKSTGEVSVVVSGGTQGLGYTYSWVPSTIGSSSSASVSSLPAGPYAVTVIDANNCKTTQTWTLTQPDAFGLVLTASPIKCFDGYSTITAAPANGTAPYKNVALKASGGITLSSTDVPAGIYEYTATDDCGVSITQNIIVPQPTPLVLYPMQTNVGCNGDSSGSAVVFAQGGTGPYTYSWYPNGGHLSYVTDLAVGTYTVTVTDANGCQANMTYVITQPEPLAVTYTQNPVKCYNQSTGSATLTVTGGTGEYLYRWVPTTNYQPTATKLLAGTYTATITDSNYCTITQDVTIAQPSAPLTITASQNNVACYGGTGNATVTVTGGTPGYTYSWAPNSENTATATDLVAGTYVLTVTDANGCSQTHKFVITQPAPLVITASQKNVTCLGAKNGVTVAKASGGTLPYSYSWTGANSPNATVGGLSGGDYSVTVTDAHSCFAVQNYTLNEPQSTFDITLDEQDNVCKGAGNGSLQVTPFGGFGNYTYKWSTGETTDTRSNLTAGSYYLTIMDLGGCVKQFTFNVTEPEVQFCKNNALCVANQTCVCQGLWNGTDCSNPICPTGCLNGGICTRPNTCTCAAGFTGIACAKTSNADSVFIGPLPFITLLILLAYLL